MSAPSVTARVGLVAVVSSMTAGLVFACADEGAATIPEGLPDVVVDAALDDVRDAAVEASLCSTVQGGGKLCNALAPIDTSINVTSVSGSGADDVWAVGTNRTVLHYDGAVWEETYISSDGGSPYTMQAVWLGRRDDVWISDGPNVRHAMGWNGAGATEWSTLTFDRPYVPSAIDGRDGTVLLARLAYSGRGALPLVSCKGWKDGSLVEAQFAPGLGWRNNGYERLTMTRADEAWATTAAAYDGQLGGVVRLFLGRPDGGSDAGPEWHVEEYDSRTRRSLNGLWGNEDVVWLVGEGGAMRRIEGAGDATKRFDLVDSPVMTDLYGVFGFAAGDVWVVGDRATVLHWNGSTWTKVPTPFDGAADAPRLLAVWGSSKTDIWIGGDGVMLHFEGSAP